MNRKNYKHGNYVDAEPNPHVDIKKYKTKDGKDDGKRYRVPDSEMKVSKKKRKGQRTGKDLMGAAASPVKGVSSVKKDKSNPIIIDLSKTKDGSSVFKIVESKAKGGRAGYKGGGMSQRGLGRAFMKGGKV